MPGISVTSPTPTNIMKYTEKVHAKRLLVILNTKDTCDRCPKYRRGNMNHDYIKKISDENEEGACTTCRDFIGIRNARDDGCPCDQLGKKESIKRTWLALEEKGYI